MEKKDSLQIANIIILTLIGTNVCESNITTRMFPGAEYFRVECKMSYDEERDILISTSLLRDTTNGVLAQANFNVSRKGNLYEVSTNSTISRDIADRVQRNYRTASWVDTTRPSIVILGLSFNIDKSRVSCDDRASYLCSTSLYNVNGLLVKKALSDKLFITFQDIFKERMTQPENKIINTTGDTRQVTTIAQQVIAQTPSPYNPDHPALIAVACSAAVAILMVVAVCLYLANKKPTTVYIDPRSIRKHGNLRQYSVFSNETSSSPDVQANDSRPQEPTPVQYLEVTDKIVYSLPFTDGHNGQSSSCLQTQREPKVIYSELLSQGKTREGQKETKESE